MNDLTKDEAVKMAREAAARHGHTLKDIPEPATVEFITELVALCRAPLVAEVAALKADSEQLRSALGKALYAMEFHQWNWNSAASDDFKREAVQHVRKAIAKDQS